MTIPSEKIKPTARKWHRFRAKIHFSRLKVGVN
jgi:hypothetical protein